MAQPPSKPPIIPENQPTYPKDFPQLISTKAVNYNVTDGDGSDLTQELPTYIDYSGQASPPGTFPNPSFTYIVQLDSSSNTYNCTVQWSQSISTITLNQKNGFNLRNYACFLSDASNFSYVYTAQKFSTGILADCYGASHLKGSIFTIGGTFAIANPALDFSSNNPLNSNVLDFNVPNQYDTNGQIKTGDKGQWTLNAVPIYEFASQSGGLCPKIGCCGGQAPISRSSEFNHPYTQGKAFCPVSMFDFKASYGSSQLVNFASGPWSQPKDQYSKGTKNDKLVWPDPPPGEYPVGYEHNFTPNGWVGFMPYHIEGDPNSPCPLGFNLGIPPGPPNAYGYDQSGLKGYPWSDPNNPQNINTNIFNIDYYYNGGWPIAPYGWKKGDFWRDPNDFFNGQKQNFADTALWSYSADELINGIGKMSVPNTTLGWGINPPSNTPSGTAPGETPAPKGAPKGAKDWRVQAAYFGSQFMTGPFMPVSSPYDSNDPSGNGTFDSKRIDIQAAGLQTPQYPTTQYGWIGEPNQGAPIGPSTQAFPIVTGGPQITILDPRNTSGAPKKPLGGWWWDISYNPSPDEMKTFTPYGRFPDIDMNYFYDKNLLEQSAKGIPSRGQSNPTNFPPPMSAVYGNSTVAQNPQPYDPKGWWKYPNDSFSDPSNPNNGLIGKPYGCRFSHQGQNNVYLYKGNQFYISNPPPQTGAHNFAGFGRWGEYAQQPVNPIDIMNGLPKINSKSLYKGYGWPNEKGKLTDGSPVDISYAIYGGLYDEDNPSYSPGVKETSAERMPEGFPSEFNNAYFPGTIQPFISWAFAQESNTSAKNPTQSPGTISTQNNATEWKIPYPKTRGWSSNWPPSRNKVYQPGKSEEYVYKGGGDATASYDMFYKDNTLNGWYPTRKQINKRIKYPPVAATGFEMKFGPDPINNPWTYYPGTLDKNEGDSQSSLIDTFVFRRSMKGYGVNASNVPITLPRPEVIDPENMTLAKIEEAKSNQDLWRDNYAGKEDVSVQFFLLDIIPNNSSYGAVWGQYSPPLPDGVYPPVFVPGESAANLDPANQSTRTQNNTNPGDGTKRRAQRDPANKGSYLKGVSFPNPNNLSEEITPEGFEITERFGKPILTYPSTSNVAAIKQNKGFYDYSGENFKGQSFNNPFQISWIPSILNKLQGTTHPITSKERPKYENNLCVNTSTQPPYENPPSSSWICGGLKQVSYGTNKFIENRQNSCEPLKKSYPACIKSNNARQYFPRPTGVPEIKDGIGQQFFDGIPACQYKNQQPGLIDDLPQLRRQVIYGDTSDPRAPRYNSYFIPGLNVSAQNRENVTAPNSSLQNYFQTPRVKFKGPSSTPSLLLTPKYDPTQENMNYAPSLSLLDYFYQPWVLGDIDKTLTNLKDLSFCLYTSIIRQQWIPNQIPMALEATSNQQSGSGLGTTPLPANDTPQKPLDKPPKMEGWNCDWCGGGTKGEGHPSNSSFFSLFTGGVQNSLSDPLEPNGRISDQLSALSTTASAAFHICFPGEKPPPGPEPESEPFNPPLPGGGNVGPDANPNPDGPQSVFFLEGRCLNGQYNCKWVRPRPWLSINYQPIAGQPLPYKYIATMGSLLAKKRQNSNIIQNATAHRKNTVVFISRGDQCGVVEPCPLFKAPAKCPQCTGNRNPNNNPI
jgi:hypothetical protein